MVTLAQKVRLLRGERSQTVVNAAAGWNYNRVSALETTAIDPLLSTAIELAIGLGCTMDALVDGLDERYDQMVRGLRENQQDADTGGGTASERRMQGDGESASPSGETTPVAPPDAPQERKGLPVHDDSLAHLIESVRKKGLEGELEQVIIAWLYRRGGHASGGSADATFGPAP